MRILNLLAGAILGKIVRFTDSGIIDDIGVTGRVVKINQINTHDGDYFKIYFEDKSKLDCFSTRDDFEVIDVSTS